MDKQHGASGAETVMIPRKLKIGLPLNGAKRCDIVKIGKGKPETHGLPQS